jgi:hypothetical protein
MGYLVNFKKYDKYFFEFLYVEIYQNFFLLPEDKFDISL